MREAHQVRVMLCSQGTVINVARVNGSGQVTSVIWSRPSSLDEGPFSFVPESPAEGADATGAARIPLAALICTDGQVSIKQAMHAVALDAANAWAKLGSAGREEGAFAQGVATVYMATLRALASDFAPDAECPGGHA